MNPFINIADITGSMPIESGKANPNQIGNAAFEGSDLNFSEILGGKLSDDPSFLFNAIQKEPNQKDVSIKQLLTAQITDRPSNLDMLSAILPIENTGVTLGETSEKSDLAPEEESANGKIDAQLLSLDNGQRSLLREETPASISFEKSNSDTLSISEGLLNSKQRSVVDKQTVQITNRVFHSQFSDKIISSLPQLPDNNPAVSARVIPSVEIGNGLDSIHKAEILSANLINNVEDNLNIKALKIKGRNDQDKTVNITGKLELPTKSYIKVTPLNNSGTENNSQQRFVNYDSNRALNAAEISRSNIEISNDSIEKTADFKTIIGSKSDQKSFIKLESGQIASQAKLNSEINISATDNSDHAKLPEARTEITPIRFVLPDNIGEKGLRGNHTVIIRMEPEHLGPVRMTVSSYNDAVTARLIVDSPMAKTTVESNLNNLMDQLDKYGIKFDAFEVSVGHGDVGREYSKDKFARYTSPSRVNDRHFKNISITDQEILQKSRRPVYIGSNGVNCFA